MLRFLLVPLLLAVSVQDVPNPRAHHDGWVSDMADQIPLAAEAELEKQLEALHRDTGVEVAVVTVDDVPGTPKAFATQLFNTWGIGNAQRNDGLLVLLVMGQRRLEMETGYGLEARLPDSWLVRTQRERMVPHFKAGNFGQGLIEGVHAVDARLRGDPAPGLAPVTGPSQTSNSPSPPGPGGAPPPVLVSTNETFLPPFLVSLPFCAFVFFLILIVFYFRWRHHRLYVLCKPCKHNRAVLDETEDDEHLDAGERREETLNSVNYVVYVCALCSSVAIDRKARFFSGYSKCSSCSYRTLSTTETVLHAATRTSTGSARITEDCKHCKHHSTYTKVIPMLPEPSSSSSSSSSSWSSSSSSSFGGGSSGGGGGGSSW